MNDGRRVIAGVAAVANRLAHDRGTQRIVLVRVGAPYAFVDHVRDRLVGVPAHIHTDLEEYHDDAGVLTHRPVPLSGHA